MKYFIATLLLFAVFAGRLGAQVGINTTSPVGPFHIDGGGGGNGDNQHSQTPTDMQLSNDIVVNDIGQLGIGTVPTTKMHIKVPAIYSASLFRMQDGNEQQNQVMMSDESGHGSWRSLSMGNNFVHWKLDHTGFFFDATGNYQHFMASDASHVVFESTVANAAADHSKLFLPKGKYIILLKGDIFTGYDETYMSAIISGTYSGESQERQFSERYIAEYTMIAADFFNFTADVSLSLKLRLLNATNNLRPTVSQITVPKPPATCPATFIINVIKLND